MKRIFGQLKQCYATREQLWTNFEAKVLQISTAYVLFYIGTHINISQRTNKLKYWNDVRRKRPKL